MAMQVAKALVIFRFRLTDIRMISAPQISEQSQWYHYKNIIEGQLKYNGYAGCQGIDYFHGIRMISAPQINEQQQRYHYINIIEGQLKYNGYADCQSIRYF